MRNHNYHGYRARLETTLQVPEAREIYFSWEQVRSWEHLTYNTRHLTWLIYYMGLGNFTDSFFPQNPWQQWDQHSYPQAIEQRQLIISTINHTIWNLSNNPRYPQNQLLRLRAFVNLEERAIQVHRELYYDPGTTWQELREYLRQETRRLYNNNLRIPYQLTLVENLRYGNIIENATRWGNTLTTSNIFQTDRPLDIWTPTQDRLNRQNIHILIRLTLSQIIINPPQNLIVNVTPPVLVLEPVRIAQDRRTTNRPRLDPNAQNTRLTPSTHTNQDKQTPTEISPPNTNTRRGKKRKKEPDKDNR